MCQIISFHLRLLQVLDVVLLLKSMAVSVNLCDVQQGCRERERLLALEPPAFSYLESREALLCYGCVQLRGFADYLHYRLSEVVRQGRYMEQFGTKTRGISFESGYEHASERRCRQCAGPFSKKYYPGIREIGTNVSTLLELPTELQLQILDFLDLRSVVRLTGTNSHLRKILSRIRLEKTMLQFELEGEGEYFLAGKWLMPCYGCVKIRPTKKFHTIELFSKCDLARDRTLERRCLECDNKNGMAFEKFLEDEEKEYEKRLESSDYDSENE
jgi:F-box domain